MMYINKKIGYLFFLLLCIPVVEISSQTTSGINADVKDRQVITTKALIIGISDYENLSDLNYAHSDAINFYNYLISPLGGYVHPQNVVLLLNDAATEANIFCGLDWLIDESFENDRIIIFFAGHSDTESRLESREGFLLCHDSPRACYRACGVSISDLHAYIQTLTSVNKSKVILITDACRAGNLASDHEGMKHTAAALAAQWENVIKVLSSKPGEYSFENKKWGKGSGVFSYYLINGLLGMADKDTNNNVTGIELYSYLSERVPEETENNQTPLYIGDPMYIISSYPYHEKDSVVNFFFTGIRSVEDPSAWHFNYVKNNSDSLTYNLYLDFWKCIDQHNLLPVIGSEICALEIYQKTLKTSERKTVSKLARNFLLSALQRKSTEVMNDWLYNGEIKDKKKIKTAIDELENVLLLIDSTYIPYKHIKSDKLFLSSLLPGNQNKKTDLLKEVIEMEHDASYAYYCLSELFLQKSVYKDAFATFMSAYLISPGINLFDYMDESVKILSTKLVNNGYHEYSEILKNYFENGKITFEELSSINALYPNYWIFINPKEIKDTLIAYQDSTHSSFQVHAIKGEVYDIYTTEPIQGAKIILGSENNTSDKVITDNNGTFRFSEVPQNGKISIIITKDGYFTDRKEIHFQLNKPVTTINDEYPLTFELLGIKTAGKINEIILYDFDEANMRPEYIKSVNELIDLLKMNPSIKNQICSHTDERGSKEYNQKLSEKRSAVVMKYLITHGTDPGRLISIGYGETRPVYPNAKTEAEHRANSRTTIEIMR